jgi:hypothetical protein
MGYAVLASVHHGNVLWYNKKLLDQHGIKIGDKITFDEFFAACDSPVGLLDFAGQAVKLENPVTPRDAPREYNM